MMIIQFNCVFNVMFFLQQFIIRGSLMFQQLIEFQKLYNSQSGLDIVL